MQLAGLAKLPFLANCATSSAHSVACQRSLLLALPRACALRAPAARRVKASFSSSRAFGRPDVVMKVAAAMLCSVFRPWYCCAEPEAHSVHSMPSRNSPRAPPVALTSSPWRRTECSDRGTVDSSPRWLAVSISEQAKKAVSRACAAFSCACSTCSFFLG